MRIWDVDRVWHRGLQIATPVALVTASTDTAIRDMMFRVWEDPTPWRMLFLISFGFVLLGLSRNSARLRRLSEVQPGTASRTPWQENPLRERGGRMTFPSLGNDGLR